LPSRDITPSGNSRGSGQFAKYSKHLVIDGITIIDIATPDWCTNILGSTKFLYQCEDRAP